MTTKVILVGCGKTKAATRSAAAELYTGDLVRKRVEYARASGARWFILSAEHGLLEPSAMIEPYDRKLSDLSKAEREAWHNRTAAKLLAELGVVPGLAAIATTVELHAGADYCEPLASLLQAAGVHVSRPVAGLFVGQQKRFYNLRVREGL